MDPKRNKYVKFCDKNEYYLLYYMDVILEL